MPTTRNARPTVNAVELRLYYDAVSRQSQFGAELSPDPPTTLFLHTISSVDLLTALVPSATTPRFKDSSALNFSGGNLWKTTGTWGQTMP